MTGDVLLVVGLLVLGYVLLLMEMFLPGGILGILGVASVVYGCWQAFALGPVWGGSAVLLSVLMTVGLVVMIVRSRTARKLVLDSRPSREWKAPEAALGDLVGREGVTLSPLRPAGIVEIEGRRLDVVADGEFLGVGVRVGVCEVEGTRVVVEPIEQSTGATDDESE